MEGEFDWISTPFAQKSRDTLVVINDIDKDSTLDKASCVVSQTLNVTNTKVVVDSLDLKIVHDNLVGPTTRKWKRLARGGIVGPTLDGSLRVLKKLDDSKSEN